MGVGGGGGRREKQMTIVFLSSFNLSFLHEGLVDKFRLLDLNT